MNTSATAATSPQALRAIVDTLHSLATVPSSVDDADRIEQLAVLEQINSATAAAIARISVDFETSQREQQRLAGVPCRQRGRGIANQIGLARHLSPTRASRQLALARELVRDLPGTFDRLARGVITEDVAAAVRAQTTQLEPADRRGVDADVAGDLDGWTSVRSATSLVRAAAHRRDPSSAAKRAARAVGGRGVWVRPTADGMASLAASLPAAQAVAALANLRASADAIIRGGGASDRTMHQVMADLVVERLTGQSHPAAVPVEVQLIMTPDALLDVEAEADASAWLTGYGPLPAAIARATLAGAPDLLGTPLAELDQGQAWVRRLFTDPITGVLTAADPKRRRFNRTLRRFIQWRDRTCREPFCDAPIHDLDHAVAHAAGGPTTLANALGVCRRFNLVKEMPGWTVRIDHDGPPGAMHTHTATITTPTGHTYRSPAPRQPAPRQPGHRQPGHRDRPAQALADVG